eukprot:scaffold23803_cov132-Cylindrotheca_fusiformis.AAC.8
MFVKKKPAAAACRRLCNMTGLDSSVSAWRSVQTRRNYESQAERVLKLIRRTASMSHPVQNLSTILPELVNPDCRFHRGSRVSHLHSQWGTSFVKEKIEPEHQV